jgi:hypothetical protein
MKRLHVLERHNFMLPFDLEVLKMSLVYEIESEHSHQIRQDEQRQEHSPLYAAKCTAEYNNGLVRRYPLISVTWLKERAHIVSVGDHLVDVKRDRVKSVAFF